MIIGTRTRPTHTRFAQILRPWMFTALAIVAGLFCLLAQASTPAEDEMFGAPTRHQTSGKANNMVLVHWVRLHGYMESIPTNAIRLANMKKEWQDCNEDNQKHGRPTTPVPTWPDYLVSERVDIYYAKNRTIHYISTIAYGVTPWTCKLIEKRGTSASLTSLQGGCDMDLDKKTATGNCDSHAHANAPARKWRTVTQQTEDAEAIRKVMGPAADSPIAKRLASAAPHYLSETKTILGIQCDVVTSLGFPGTACMSRGGSFATCDAYKDVPQSCVMLENKPEIGFVFWAVEAKLDTLVDASIFAPYLAGGFSITNIAFPASRASR